MCGISGIYDFSGDFKSRFSDISEKFLKKLHKRGPDSQGNWIENNILLTHNRLSVIDTSEKASQPMVSESGIVIVFNGEIFNFKTLRNELLQKGAVFHSNSDTEVVLQLYIHEGTEFLKKLNGFFALAIYDPRSQELIIARDKYGIKPLLFYYDNEMFVFSSEMKSILEAIEPQELDFDSLRMFFQLTYIPPPYTIFKNIHKLIPGCYLVVKNNASIQRHCYSEIAQNRYKSSKIENYNDACNTLKELLDESVSSQLVSDVPLGCFLSGGIDSSIITALASNKTPNLKTFSIGFRDEPFYDETRYAQIVAEKFKTDHTAFSLTNDDLFEAVEDMLDYIDEPFADSSALAVYVLSRETKKHVTVALSGDGADEMFGGYNKHLAEYRIRQNKFGDRLLKSSAFLWNTLPASRNGKMSNTVRQMRKYLRVMKLDPMRRYLELSSFNQTELIERLIIMWKKDEEFATRMLKFSEEIKTDVRDIEDVMLSDMKMVLTGDMLPKVDMMSMANSLEVRPPFLDSSIVDFAFSIPTSFKISGNTNKRILRDSFKDILPPEILKRGKHGFEVPMSTWFQTEMRPMIDKHLQSTEFIKHQNLFRQDVIDSIVGKVLQSTKHDLQAMMWCLLVFQYWYKKYEHHIKPESK
jgi:asparagine synthase (glutamine-hydrolysing)